MMNSGVNGTATGSNDGGTINNNYSVGNDQNRSPEISSEPMDTSVIVNSSGNNMDQVQIPSYGSHGKR